MNDIEKMQIVADKIDVVFNKNNPVLGVEYAIRCFEPSESLSRIKYPLHFRTTIGESKVDTDDENCGYDKSKLNGIVFFEEITKEEFERQYPDE